MGHLIDLPKSRLAINIDDNFQPEYNGEAKNIKELQKDAKNLPKCFASDNDREGEAIAWHLKMPYRAKQRPIYGVLF